jgi:uncharacterized protein (DUF885 family)
MKRAISLVLALFIVAACGGGGGSGGATPPVVTPPPAPTAADQLKTDLAGLPLDQFYEASFAALTYREPETIIWNALTSLYPLDSAGLNIVSDAYQRETFAMVQVVLDALRTYDRNALTPDEQLTYDVYEYYLQDTVDRLPFIYHDFVATYNFNGVQDTTERFFSDIHPLATEQDALDFIARLNAVRTKFTQVADHLTLQNGAGIIEPRLTLDVALSRTNQIANSLPQNTIFYTTFVSKLDGIAGLSDARKQQLRDLALSAVGGSVIPGYRTLATRMSGLRPNAPTSIGVGQYPNGAAYYIYLLRHRTTTNLTAAEIHQLGLDELDRIHTEMRVIFDSLGYPQNETLAQLYARVATDGGIIPAANVKATYESIIDAAELELDQAFDIFPSADVIVAEDAFGGFYIAPSFDGTRPGAFYAGTQNDEAWFAMPSLAYHEAVPGHHTQIAIGMEQGGPSLRRAIRYTAFVEGWALYAERLAYELGWYDNDPYGNLGRLQFEALRAARLVIDTGIHSMGWTFDQAVQFNQDNLGASRVSSEGAAGRYSVVPAQATAYMIGMLDILRLRQEAMDALGSEFDLIEFHRVVLTSGGIPLALLEGVIDRYVAEKLAMP